MKPDAAPSPGTEIVYSVGGAEAYKHFAWPLQSGRGPLVNATLWDEIAEMIDASRLVSGVPSGSILWRTRPEWFREREYDTQRNLSWLCARGAFPA
jgi:hypothetical protein